MQVLLSQVNAFVLIFSTLFIFLFGCAVVYFIFLFQKKRYRHLQEVLELREAFSQTLLQSKLEIQEQTLDHISKELHANFSHLVSLININLSGILPESADSTKESILETKSLAKQLLSELKALSASLNTDHIMHIGFSKALENELARIGTAKKYTITFTKTGQEYRLLPENEIILFRLCQEVLNNVIKYAKAKNVTTILDYSSEAFKLSIADDGIGFDTALAEKQSAEKESTGMLNIRKRARLINAEVTIKSTPGLGTQITILIPSNSELKK